MTVSEPVFSQREMATGAIVGALSLLAVAVGTLVMGNPSLMPSQAAAAVSTVADAQPVSDES